MSGQDHIQNVKKHFISGEPGTTGREPFEETGYSATIPGQHSTHDPKIMSLGDHQSRDQSAASATASHIGQGDLAGHHSHGTGAGLASTTGTHSSHDNDNRGVVDKVKDALPGSSSSTSNTHSSTTAHSSHTNSHATPIVDNGTGAPEPKRSIVDKINDALPGTPAKTEQHYGTSHNPASTAAPAAGVGALSSYSSGHQATSGSGPFAGSERHNDGGVGGGSSLAGGGVGHGTSGDRVGHAGQESAKYEGNLHGGPKTGGAAGTDRFDSDRTGAPGNVGAGLNRQYDDGVHQETGESAPGKSKGGLSGLLATSDKDFTGRERKGEGAYADTDGLYKLNSTGPQGNSALTGREGTIEKNPVARAQGTHTSSTTTGEHGVHGEEHGEKKGLLAKVKDALS